LNTKKGFDEKVAAEISKITGYEFITAPNKASVARAFPFPSFPHPANPSSRLLPLTTPSSRLPALSTLSLSA
jgi:hypothetical protein